MSQVLSYDILNSSNSHIYIVYVYMYVCMYACMYACMYVCMHVCMYVWFSTAKNKFPKICACMILQPTRCSCMYVCSCICMVLKSQEAYVCVGTCYIYIYIYMGMLLTSQEETTQFLQLYVTHNDAYAGFVCYSKFREFMCVCVCLCVYVCMYVCMYIYIYMNAYVYMNVLVHVCMLNVY